MQQRVRRAYAHWTMDELKLLRTYYGRFALGTVVALLPRHSRSSILTRAFELGCRSYRSRRRP